MREAEKDLLLNNLPGLAYRCSISSPWRMHYVSRGARHVVSYRPEDLMDGTVPWGSIMHPDDSPQVERDVAEAIAAGKPFDLVYRIHDVQRGERWVSDRGEAVFEDGVAVALVGFICDVTHQQLLEANLRKRETELRRAQERYQLATRATGDIVWDRDLESEEIQRLIPETSAFHGEPAEIGKQWWRDHLHPEDRPRVEAGLERLAATGGDRWHDEYRMRRPDGSYAHILDRGFSVPALAGEPRRIVGVMQDISDRVAADAKVRRLQAELVHLSKIGGMGIMAATLAHELSQPLAAASNFLNSGRLLLQGGGDREDERLGAVIHAAEQQLRRAGEIIHRARALLQKRPHMYQDSSLAQLVANVATLLDAARTCAAERIDASIEPGADYVRVDPVQIEQVLLNLIRNASEATEGATQHRIIVSAFPSALGWVEVQVRDRGRGLAPETMANLFAPFSGTSGNGLGVGLSISRTIIEDHGGRIWAANNPDGGSTFHFTVPASELREQVA